MMMLRMEGVVSAFTITAMQDAWSMRWLVPSRP
jgi:hypothetical protein